MAEFRIATEAELRPILEVLTSLEWPVPFGIVPELFERLGWEQQTRKIGKTSLPVSFKSVSFGELRGGELSKVEFRVSDTLDGDGPAEQKIVAEAFPCAVRAVSACLGFEPNGTPRVTTGVRWEFDNGGLINLLNLGNCIKLQLWSKRFADIEREEIRQGVAPDQVFNAPE